MPSLFSFSYKSVFYLVCVIFSYLIIGLFFSNLLSIILCCLLPFYNYKSTWKYGAYCKT